MPPTTPPRLSPPMTNHRGFLGARRSAWVGLFLLATFRNFSPHASFEWFVETSTHVFLLSARQYSSPGMPLAALPRPNLSTTVLEVSQSSELSPSRRLLMTMSINHAYGNHSPVSIYLQTTIDFALASLSWKGCAPLFSKRHSRIFPGTQKFVRYKKNLATISRIF